MKTKEEILSMPRRDLYNIYITLHDFKKKHACNSNCKTCDNCINCTHCTNCKNCKNCYMYVDLELSEYCICNVQLSKKEYETKLKELKELKELNA